MAILTTAPQDEVILGGVSEVGEFRIRNSAKAFNILSSGLYANKIKAIVRELSTNAVDSHVAAGRATTPFDVHLPNALEPWFAIRDYGTGLDHEQVTQIYTTYFESTKTGSNDFVGALGLGSKSPFAYTDNFTVTAVKDGMKRIYSAFINQQGVPSIAQMSEHTSNELSGVEVKFSVNDSWEYSKFRDEASRVYAYFDLKPVVTGSAEFKIQTYEYETRDIIPGVHHRKGSSYSSIAVMGNIAYPIEIPQAQQKELGELAELLACGLEMHFGIGELDFQASREGLSYIPQTIQAIKDKLQALNSALAGHIAKEADAIENEWSRAVFLLKRRDSRLWRAAISEYVTASKFELVTGGYGKEFEFEVDDLAKKYNIALDGFRNYVYNNTSSTLHPHNNHAQGLVISRTWKIPVYDGTVFVKNDLKTGAVARAKYHFKQNPVKDHSSNYTYFMVMSRFDKTKAADFDGFLAALHNPHRVVTASELDEKERAARSGIGKNVTILTLESRETWGRRSEEIVWANGGKASEYDNSVHVYVPLSGYNSLLEAVPDAKRLYRDLKNVGIKDLRVLLHGVRRDDLAWVESQKNWVRVDNYIKGVLKKVDTRAIEAMVLSGIDLHRTFRQTEKIVKLIEDQTSPYLALVNKFDGRSKDSDFNIQSLCRIFATFAKKKLDVEKMTADLKAEVSKCTEQYPLLTHLDYYTPAEAIASYINIVDAKK